MLRFIKQKQQHENLTVQKTPIKSWVVNVDTAQKMTFSIKDFYRKCNQICRKLWICLHLLDKSSMRKFIFVQCNNIVISKFVEIKSNFKCLIGYLDEAIKP